MADSKASQKEDFVYFEDVQGTTAPTSTTTEGSEEVADSPVPAKTQQKSPPANKPAGGLKRQRTLMEMVATGSKSTTGQAPKKVKLEHSDSPSSGEKTPASSSLKQALVGKQSLNSIPFSMSAYLESLTEEEKKLLQLECETMGKSW